MKSIKSYIPNTLTCCNFLCGCIAVYLTLLFHGEPTYLIYAFCLIILGALFDFCDGMSARLLGVSSGIGKELDSLADATTFGLAPTTMLFIFTYNHIGWAALISLLMAAFSILRLAKFNLDTRQTTSFIGLATPANALFWAPLICILSSLDINPAWSWVLLGFSLISCFLLVSEIPFFSLKFHDLKWENNKIRYIFIGCAVLTALCAIIIGAFKEILITALLCAVVTIILIYIILALIDNIINAKRQ
ncbi:MAG: CDP-diacylglycerol--serine O-phosphatidyltransferase [Paludibacteraceae bacterium]|nr:CDP-diacylglycerol--serine O-phosphatidyltransferase [Paludibacteraceae bacterium]